MNDILQKASDLLPFSDLYSFSQEKCFEMFTKLEKKIELNSIDELTLLLLSILIQNYFEKLNEENLQNSCHCFILSQMAFARMVESKGDLTSLGLLVHLVERFVSNLESFLKNQRNSEKGEKLKEFS